MKKLIVVIGCLLLVGLVSAQTYWQTGRCQTVSSRNIYQYDWPMRNYQQSFYRNSVWLNNRSQFQRNPRISVGVGFGSGFYNPYFYNYRWQQPIVQTQVITTPPQVIVKEKIVYVPLQIKSTPIQQEQKRVETEKIQSNVVVQTPKIKKIYLSQGFGKEIYYLSNSKHTNLYIPNIGAYLSVKNFKYFQGLYKELCRKRNLIYSDENFIQTLYKLEKKEKGLNYSIK